MFSIPYGSINRTAKTRIIEEAYAKAYLFQKDCQLYIEQSRYTSTVIYKGKAVAWQKTCLGTSPKIFPKPILFFISINHKEPKVFPDIPNSPNTDSRLTVSTSQLPTKIPFFSSNSYKVLHSNERCQSEVRSTKFSQNEYPLFPPFSQQESLYFFSSMLFLIKFQIKYSIPYLHISSRLILIFIAFTTSLNLAQKTLLA